MRTLNMIMGILFVAAGIYMIANEGVTFLSVAFVLGLLFMIGGLVVAFSYNSYRGENSEKAWILVDGLTTFVLGALIIFNKLAADAIVPLVLGLWIIISGIGNIVRCLERIKEKDAVFYGHFLVGVLNVVAGVYMYFNGDLLALAVGAQTGICVLAQGLNIFMQGCAIIVFKPEILKTKEEILDQVVKDAEEAKRAAKEAIVAVREAEAIVKKVEETPEELLDTAMAPKPGEKIEISHVDIDVSNADGGK